jgi:PAS domain S-box-containing protein
MSPITSVLYVFICIGYLGIRQNNSHTFRYIGGGLSLTAFLVSVVLLIGYLYSAPLLYGGKIIPVSLPSSICFILFSFSLLRVYESQFFSFEHIVKNKVTRLLLKSFLQIVIFIRIIQGFLDSVFNLNYNNPSLTSALILLVFLVATSFIVYRVSAIIGDQLLKAEKMLKESEEKFLSILENSADAIFITNPKGEFVYTNNAVTDMLGYTSDEMKKMSFSIISPRHGQGEYFGIFKQILSRGNAFAEIELLKKDGTFIPAEINTFLLPGGNIFGNCRDISERKLAENVRIESNTKYRLIADYNFDWEFWITNEKKFRYNSPSCEKISGYKPSDF